MRWRGGFTWSNPTYTRIFIIHSEEQEIIHAINGHKKDNRYPFPNILEHENNKYAKEKENILKNHIHRTKENNKSNHNNEKWTFDQDDNKECQGDAVIELFEHDDNGTISNIVKEKSKPIQLNVKCEYIKEDNKK